MGPQPNLTMLNYIMKWDTKMKWDTTIKWDTRMLTSITITEWDITKRVWDPEYESIKWDPKYDTLKDKRWDPKQILQMKGWSVFLKHKGTQLKKYKTQIRSFYLHLMRPQTNTAL